ncbi:MAG: O-antigen ligase family protein [Bacillota bacterium]
MATLADALAAHLGPMLGRLQPAARVALEKSACWAWVTRPQALEGSLHLLILALPILPPELLLAAAALPIAFYAAQVISGTAPRSRTPVDLPLAVYYALAVLATATSVDPRGSLRDLAINTCAFGLFLAITRAADRKMVLRLLNTLLLAGTLVAAYGVYQYLVGVPVDKAWYDVKLHPELRVRVYSTFGNPNVLAEYLGLVIPFGLAGFVSQRRPQGRLLLASSLAVMTACLLFTYSRGGWLGLAVAVLVFVLFRERRVMWILPAVALLSYLAAPEVVLNRVASMVSLKDASNAHRVGVWLASLAMLRDFWLTGVGLGHRAFMQVYAEYKLKGRFAWHSHSLFLEQAIELGIVGLAVFLWVIFTVYRTGLHYLRPGRRDPTSHAPVAAPPGRAVRAAADPAPAIVMAGLAAVSGTLFHGLVENILYMATITISFWMVVALTIATGKIWETAAGGVSRSGGS